MVDPRRLPPVVRQPDHRLPQRTREHERPVEQRADERALPVLSRSRRDRTCGTPGCPTSTQARRVSEGVALPAQELKPDVLDGPRLREVAVGVGRLGRQRHRVLGRDVELGEDEARPVSDGGSGERGAPPRCPERVAGARVAPENREPVPGGWDGLPECCGRDLARPETTCGPCPLAPSRHLRAGAVPRPRSGAR